MNHDDVAAVEDELRAWKEEHSEGDEIGSSTTESRRQQESMEWSGVREKLLQMYRFNPPEGPEITLSAITETGKVESTIPVLKQRSYTGRRPVITSSLANTLCTELGVDGVLEKLNNVLGTSHTLDSVSSVLKSYVEQNYDFGTVYSYLRPYWDDDAITTVKHELCTREEKDREMRRSVLVHEKITPRWVDPRRAWDLCANRVVPWWVAEEYPLAISHAWVDKKDRMDVLTPINAYEWPVPMPKDTNLDLIRIEMLNHGAQYAWLDVLCLRQEGGKGEHLRLEEWKLDVPTIGYVYEKTSEVVCYFNGLGRPLHLTADYFQSDRCWFRRAWTLQEIADDPIIGGETGDDVMEKEVWMMFKEELTRLRGIQNRELVLELTSEMQNRVSTKLLDKVAGLAYLLHSDSIPIYNAGMSDVEAWEILIDCLWSVAQAELFFSFPEPGNGRKYWRPSWHQIMTSQHFISSSLQWEPGDVKHMEGMDWYWGYYIDSADVQGLAKRGTEEKVRQGEIVLNNTAGSHHTFKVVAHHPYPIPDGSYALIGNSDKYSDNVWVVGWQREDGKFQKLLVFHSTDNESVKLWKLGLRETKIILL